jgi:hypothetical protein
MARTNQRLDVARRAYREALESARANPTPEAWARLLAAGKELSAAEEPRPRGRRRRDNAMPPLDEAADLERLE